MVTATKIYDIPPSVVGDNDWIAFGDVYEMALAWDTRDANANCGKIDLPTGGAIDVPVLALGIGIIGQDLDLFNGFTETQFAVVDADKDSYIAIGFESDDKAHIKVGGNASGVNIAISDKAGANLYAIHAVATLDGPTGWYYGLQSDVIKSGTSGIDDCTAVTAYIEQLAGNFTLTGRFAPLQVLLSGSGTVGTITKTGVGAVYVAWIANRGTQTNTDAILCVHNQSAATATVGILMDISGTVTYGIDMNGAAFGTADIRLRNGNIINNSAAGIIDVNASINITYAGCPLIAQNTTDAASNEVLRLKGGNRATPAANDETYIAFYLDDSTGTQVEYGRITCVATDVTAASQDARFVFTIMKGDTLTEIFRMDSTSAGAVTGVITAPMIFAESTAPAATNCYVVRDNTGDLTFNALSGKSVHCAVAGADVLDITDTNVIDYQNLIVGGTSLLGGGVICNSTLSVAGALVVNGASSFNSSLGVAGALVVNGGSSFNSTLGVASTLTVTGAGSFNSTLGVTGSLTVNGAGAFNSTLGVAGSLTVNNAATFAVTMSVGGVLTLLSDLDMSTSGTGVYDLILKTNMADALSIKDSAGDLIVFNTTAGAQEITITPSVTLNGTVSFYGVAGFAGSAFIVAAPATFTSSVGIAGALTGTSATFSSSVGIAGATTMTSATCSTTLGVAGAFTGTLGSFSSTLGVAGVLTTNQITCNSTLGVAGAVTLGSTLALGGKLTAGANEIEGSNFDIDGGDISACTISGGLTWSAAQNLNSQALTNVNIDSGDISAVTISGGLTWSAAQTFGAFDATFNANVIVDNTTTGANANSGAVYLRGNYWTGAADVEVEAYLQLVGGIDPYLRLYVDNGGAAPAAVSVFDIHDTIMVCNVAGFSVATHTDNADTLLFQAYDVDGAAYTTLITLTAANTPTLGLAGVSSLVAVGNLDIGAFDFRAATLTADGLTAGRVIFAGANGLLSDDADFTFSVDTLTVTKIATYKMTGDLIINDVNWLVYMNSATDKVVQLNGGPFAAGSGSLIQLYGKTHATQPGAFRIQTPNAAGNDGVVRLAISGVLATAVATWASITHTGLVLSASQKLYPVSGVAGLSVVSTALTLGSLGSIIHPQGSMSGAANDAARDALAGDVDGAMAVDGADVSIWARCAGAWKHVHVA